jgi:nucleoside-diphosphate-sugar epimerase
MKVLIIGCGWLGLPLGEKLVDLGMTVWGTTTQEKKLINIERKGIQPILFNMTTELKSIGIQEIFPDVAIITIPPSSSDDYPEIIRQIVQSLPETCKIIFTSSIGVYKVIEGLVDEHSACQLNHPVYQAEEVIRDLASTRSVILRLGGLFGAGRHPIHFLAGRKALAQGYAPVNLVHLNDVIEAIQLLVFKGISNQLFNLVYPDHPKKIEYYPEKARRLGLIEPVYSTDTTDGKMISSDKIIQNFGFKYSHDLWNDI